MSVENQLENLLEAGNSTLSIADKGVVASVLRQARAMDEKDKAKGEGGEEPKAEDDEDAPKVEGDEDAPKAGSDDDAPKAETDDDAKKAEEDDETPEARASAIMTYAAANGHLKMSEKLLNNKKLTSAEAIDLMKSAKPEATAALQILQNAAPQPLADSSAPDGPSAQSDNPAERIKAARATLNQNRRRR